MHPDDHPHPDKAHVMRQYRRYLLACKRSWGSTRALFHRRALIRTYLFCKRAVIAQGRSRLTTCNDASAMCGTAPARPWEDTQ